MAVCTYLALRSFANASGTCFPSHKAIAERAGISERSVAKALKKHKLIRVKRRKDSSNLYTVIDPLTREPVGDLGSAEAAWQAVMEAEDLPEATL